MRASFSIMNLPARAACQLVPQAMIFTCRKRANSAGGDIHLVEEDAAGLLADAAQRGIADGARLLEDLLEHEMLVAALLRQDGVPQDVGNLAVTTGRPSKSLSRTPSGVSTAMSPSARKNMSCVWLRMAGTSEATKYSLSPMPITTGGPERAATILFGSEREITASAKTPVSSLTAPRTASSRLPLKCFSTRWAMTSVSVSVLKTWPSDCSCCLSAR